MIRQAPSVVTVLVVEQMATARFQPRSTADATAFGDRSLARTTSWLQHSGGRGEVEANIRWPRDFGRPSTFSGGFSRMFTISGDIDEERRRDKLYGPKI